jgi:hypothetical protein
MPLSWDEVASRAIERLSDEELASRSVPTPPPRAVSAEVRAARLVTHRTAW